MRKLFFLIFMACGLLMLAGCGPVYQTVYSYIPPHSWRGRQCVNECVIQRTYCQNACKSQNDACRANAKLAAYPAYHEYKKEQKKAGQPVWETVDNFADYSACSDSCGCSSTYRTCFTNCGGSVMASSQCVAFCNKK